MSQENVDLVLAAGRLFDAQDWASLSELLDASVVTHWPEPWPDAGVFAGRDTVIGHFRRTRRDLIDGRLSAEAMAESGDWVAVRWHLVVERPHPVMEEAQPDAPSELRISAAYRFDEGQITDIRLRWDHDEALEAAGLRE